VTESEQKGFTLVELLVAIAVLGILASLLLPVLSRGKLRAQTAKCGSNLGQFVVAAQMYWDDNNGNPFPYVGATTADGTYYWFGLLGQGPEEKRAFDPSAGPLYPWLGAGVDLCPAFDYASPQFKLKGTNVIFSYGGNAYLFAGPRGSGKEAMARTLAKALNCSEKNHDSCERCDSCRRVEEGVHPDVYWVRPESKLRQIRIRRDLPPLVSTRCPIRTVNRSIPSARSAGSTNSSGASNVKPFSALANVLVRAQQQEAIAALEADLL